MLCNDYWFFEGGTILGSPDEVLDLGDTEVTQVVFMDFSSGIEGQHFRFVTKTPAGYSGFQVTGMIEGFQLRLEIFDFGDLLGRKILASIFLGSLI